MTDIVVDQLSRLRMILKPFMLRRVKKDIELEIGEKVRNFPHFFTEISRHFPHTFLRFHRSVTWLFRYVRHLIMISQVEVELRCSLTARQKKLYKNVKEKMPLAELLKSKKKSNDSMSSLMNLVMQFRKVRFFTEISNESPRNFTKSSLEFSVENSKKNENFIRKSREISLKSPRSAHIRRYSRGVSLYHPIISSKLRHRHHPHPTYSYRPTGVCYPSLFPNTHSAEVSGEL